MIICRHCGQPATHRHQQVCLSSPAVRESVRQTLEDSSRPGFSHGEREYNVRRASTTPSGVTLRNHLGTWSDVAAAFGLVFVPQRVGDGRIDRTIAELRRLSAELHDGQIAPSKNEYRIYGDKGTAYEIGTIMKYHDFNDLCRLAGLTIANRSYYLRRTYQRRQEAERLDDKPDGIAPSAARRVDAEIGVGAGLQVSRVREMGRWANEDGTVTVRYCYSLR